MTAWVVDLAGDLVGLPGHAVVLTAGALRSVPLLMLGLALKRPAWLCYELACYLRSH